MNLDHRRFPSGRSLHLNRTAEQTERVVAVDGYIGAGARSMERAMKKWIVVGLALVSLAACAPYPGYYSDRYYDGYRGRYYDHPYYNRDRYYDRDGYYRGDDRY